ncbi:DUF4251 domain-containing protein [Sinomicrobium soli]|uniref:DUF4251 domain-containing protein n=1 Tax=Sinomicrobium sp. N-1-3-6 TaxID=2219864 RepID=UPI000DCEC012|nr:DUF4251 domain-containing protein [Sinomicrobium sp. N-1-3-6]RAV30665.1 DUF4251 domain-containing protein [Sinomicrobium sp. N-1-3-6]
MKRFISFSGVLLLLGMVVLSSCGGARSAAPQDMAALDSLIRSREFRVESDWANPMVTTAMMRLGNILGPQNNIQRVNLIGNSNYLEIRGDSVKAELPYFGERRMGGGYDPDGNGIKFDQKASGMNIKYVDSKKLYRITFEARQRSESYNITLEIFANRKTNMIVNSTQRAPIGFEGTVRHIEE